MPRTIIAILALAALGGAVRASTLFTEPDVQRVGLTRRWFTQANADRSRGTVRHVSMHKELLIVQTEQAIVQAIDAETGRSIWTQQIGRPNYPSLAAAANDDVVAVVSGSKLYVVERATGVVLWSRLVGSSPGAGAAITDRHVFVPMINGLVEAYELEHPDKTPWSYRSFGRIFVEPVVVGTNVGWTTDKGYFYAANTEGDPVMRVRLESRDAIESKPAYWPPYLYACSLDGYVYAVHEKTAANDWKYTTGGSISRAPVAVEGAVYVSPDRGGLFKLDGLSGQELWIAPGIAQFVAVTPTRVYAADRLNRLAVLDGATGRRLGTLAPPELGRWLPNGRSDRILWLGESGVLQCLHEIDRTEPLVYEKKLPEPKPTATVQRGLDEPAEAAGGEPDVPTAEAPGDDAASDPFGGDDAGAMDADGAAAEADDFGS